MQIPADTEISVVGDCDRLLVIPDSDHPRNRTKDFLACNLHAVVDLGEQGRLQIEARIVAIEDLSAPMELRTLVLANRDVSQVLIKLALIDNRSDMGTGLQGIVND